MAATCSRPWKGRFSVFDRNRCMRIFNISVCRTNRDNVDNVFDKFVIMIMAGSIYNIIFFFTKIKIKKLITIIKGYGDRPIVHLYLHFNYERGQFRSFCVIRWASDLRLFLVVLPFYFHRIIRIKKVSYFADETIKRQLYRRAYRSNYSFIVIIFIIFFYREVCEFL